MIGGWLGLLTAVILMIRPDDLRRSSAMKSRFTRMNIRRCSRCSWPLSARLFSITDSSLAGQQERERFRAQFVRSQTGLGISQGSSH